MQFAIWFATSLLAIVLALPLYRVVKGPSVFDRLLGAGVLGTKIVTLILLIGELFGRLDMFIDIALAYAILNFIGALTVAKYMRAEGVTE
ncbi:MAG: monovalent cation/H+ antiporter complex subunit F [Planctomycetota bacterium]|jgi:multicomponent Na+:H+ antiporter subunit F